MNIRECKSRMISEILPLYGDKESRSLIDLLMKWATGLDRVRQALEPEYPLTPLQMETLESALSDLRCHRPVQYITGTALFCNLEFMVDESVLIPRQETGELVQWILSDSRGMKSLKILDAGTGSGCIGISLAKELPGTLVTAIDITEEALAVARRNALHHRVKIRLLLRDMLAEAGWSRLGQYDVVVSNPPYVRESEKKAMLPNVLNFEPATALFVKDDDPLQYYRAIAENARKVLVKSGRLYVEINENLGGAARQLFLDHGFHEVVLKKDIYGKDRMIRAQ